MKIEQITLAGFLSYKNKQVISLADIENVCIINGSINGDQSLSNGAGKSSLFESIPVCFFGKIGGRSNQIDNYINHDKEEMSIEVIFIIDSTRYKCYRYRKRNDTSKFEIFYDSVNTELENAKWKVTDKKIEDIIGLSFSTFNSTIYLSEREALKFIQGTSSERKEILGELLNIVYYDAASTKCNEKSKDFKKKSELTQVLINSKKSNLINEKQIQSSIDEYEEAIKKINKTTFDLNQKFETLESEKNNLAIIQKNVNIIKEQISAEREYLDDFNQQKDEHETKIRRLKNDLRLNGEKLTSMRIEVKENDQKKLEIETDLKEITDSLEKITGDSSKIEENNIKIKEFNTTIKNKEKLISGMESEINQVEKYLEKMTRFSNVCPITEENCEIVKTDKVKIKEEKEKFIKAKQKDIDKLNDEIKEVGKLLNVLEEESRQVIKDIDTKNNINRKISELNLKLNNFKNKKTNFENSTIQINENNEKIQLEIDEFIKKLEELKDKISIKIKKIDDLQEKIQGDFDESYYQNLLRNISSLKREIDSFSDSILNHNKNIAILKNKLKENEQVKLDILELEEKNKGNSTNEYVFNTLTNIFGKDGIQKSIMKNAVPILEKTTNELLKIFNNDEEKFQIKFELDPKTAKGDFKKAGGLEIMVIEEGRDPKDLGMYSGGETVRIVFSIILGLSQLLSMRSGKKHETLIIDEKIAKLDKRGIEQFAEIINKISSWYNQIFIITHIDDLKEMFTGREILVDKTEDGSFVKII